MAGVAYSTQAEQSCLTYGDAYMKKRVFAFVTCFFVLFLGREPSGRFSVGIPLKKSSKTIPATWDLLGGARTTARHAGGGGTGRSPSKSQVVEMVFDDFLHGIPTERADF